ncbi:hypothetical protein CA599_16825, partial [Paenibacillus taichungensis]
QRSKERSVTETITAGRQALTTVMTRNNITHLPVIMSRNERFQEPEIIRYRGETLEEENCIF